MDTITRNLVWVRYFIVGVVSIDILVRNRIKMGFSWADFGNRNIVRVDVIRVKVVKKNSVSRNTVCCHGKMIIKVYFQLKKALTTQ